MGQNNDRRERGEPQGQQGKQRDLSPEERKRQSGYAKPTDRSRFAGEAPSLKPENSKAGKPGAESRDSVNEILSLKARLHRNGSCTHSLAQVSGARMCVSNNSHRYTRKKEALPHAHARNRDGEVSGSIGH